MSDLYGQQERMEDPVMAAILAAQERVIWPQEEPLLRSLGAGPGARIADLGCGSGLIAARLAGLGAEEVVGIDLFADFVETARRRFPLPNLRFEQGDAKHTGLPTASFDLVLCRCVLQAIPDYQAVLQEMRRLCKPSGRIYVLAEDYGLIFGHPLSACAQEFYLQQAAPAALKAGSDLLSGRRIPAELLALGCDDLRVDVLPIDTVRCDRKDLAEVFRTWGLGYADFVHRHGGGALDAVKASFEAQRQACLDPQSYLAWLLLAVSARPGAS